MINIFFFLSIAFIFTFLVGIIIEKWRIPWIFASLVLGTMLAVYNPFTAVTNSQTFIWLANIGMYFLLFVIGFEIDLNKLKDTSKLIIKSTFLIIFFEGFAGTFVVHYFFGYDWVISFVVALSFATVGEAILIPVLDEFKIVNTKIGQSIIGIGSLDDIIEVAMLVAVMFITGSGKTAQLNMFVALIALIILFFMSFGLTKLREEGKKFNYLSIDILFLFALFILFLFLAIGELAHATAIAALLSGIAFKTFIPGKRLKTIESEIKTMSYGFFAPIFFLWVGLSMDISYILSYPALIFIVALTSITAKIIGSYLVTRKELGGGNSIILGIGISVRFSTSIVIIKILFDNGIIGNDIYSAIVASTILFTFIVPLLFSKLVPRITLQGR